jgi:hypothetical protein
MRESRTAGVYPNFTCRDAVMSLSRHPDGGAVLRGAGRVVAGSWWLGRRYARHRCWSASITDSRQNLNRQIAEQVRLFI